jgi:uncharacterized protein (DUF2062 family)
LPLYKSLQGTQSLLLVAIFVAVVELLIIFVVVRTLISRFRDRRESAGALLRRYRG